MSKREPKQERGEVSRNNLLSAAMELMAERGLSGLSHRAVAKRADISYGMVGYFYDSLDDLMLDAIRHHYSARIADYESIASALVDVEVSATALARGAAEILTSSTMEMLLAHLEVYLNASRDPRIRDELTPIFAAMHEVAALVADRIGIEDRERYAQAVIAVIEGNQLRRVAQGIDATEELTYGLRLLTIGALAEQAQPNDWEDRLLARTPAIPRATTAEDAAAGAV